MKDTPYYKQAQLLLRILPFIYKQEDFALKGGTAINFFYRNLPRLSVDIDLTYLPIQNRSDTLLNIHNLLNDLKYKIEQSIPNTNIVTHRKNAQIRKLTTRSDKATIKIEPNTTIRGSLFPPEKRKLQARASDLFEVSVKSQTLSLADLYGGKICAALDRQHPRDLFDIRLLLQNEGITEDIKNAFISYLISHNRPMIELLDPGYKDIKEMYDKEFVGMTTIDISEEELIEARTSLIKKINNILTNEDKRFLISMNSGNPDWNLFKYPKIKRFPSVQWKLLNINKVTEGKPDKHKEIYTKLKDYLGKEI